MHCAHIVHALLMHCACMTYCSGMIGTDQLNIHTLMQAHLPETNNINRQALTVRHCWKGAKQSLVPLTYVFCTVQPGRPACKQPWWTCQSARHQYKLLSDIACREQIEEAVRARFAAEEADLKRVIGESQPLHWHRAEDCGLRMYRVSVTDNRAEHLS